MKGFEALFKNRIKDYNFELESWVLVQNSWIEKELNWKIKLRYLGPMAVLWRTAGESYLLAELDGSISKLCYVAFQLIPYYTYSYMSIPVTNLTRLSEEELGMLEGIEDAEPDDEDHHSPE